VEPQHTQRKLTTILAADVEGYTRLMRADEEATLITLGEYRDVIDGLMARHEGRVFSTGGDSVLAEFGSAVEAVRCAISCQEEISSRNTELTDDRKLRFRIGINVGDVMVRDGDLFGDGVNVAARLEGLAESGGICISGSVFEQIKHKLSLGFEDMGPQEVKNIAEPVRTYRVQLGDVVSSVIPTKPDDELLPLPEKPSIAVLPFENMSGDPEQEYFSDGITEDLITALSRVRWLLVIARNTTFTYKGRAVDIKQVAEELGVRYVLEGSVRKSGNRVRITTQLIDGLTGNHVWAERYDRKLEDVFALQDELSLTLCGAIEPELAKSEQQRSKSKAPENLDAWECYHHGMWLWQRNRKDEVAEARRLFERAMELDPNFGPAFAGYAITYFREMLIGFSERDREKALWAARRAVELDDEDASAHTALGLVHYIDREHHIAIAECKHAIQLNPSFAEALALLGSALSDSGKAEEAIPHIEQAIRLSPRDPMIGPTHARMARAFLFLRQHEKAVEWARTGLRHPNINWPIHSYLVSALSHLGIQDEARRALDDLLEFRPSITIGFIGEHLPITDTDYRDHLLEGLRRAGMPEK
jgi:adenylate cyclase